MQLAYYGHYHCPADGRIYVVPRCATQAAFFDTATKTWETFGDTFPKSQFMENDKWMIPAVSSIDNCMYSFPFVLNDATRILKIDPTHATAKEVGEDLWPPAAGVILSPWHDAVAGPDGCIFGIPCSATSVIRFDPRTSEHITFGQLDDTS